MPGKIHVPVTVATNGFDKLQRTFGRLKGVALGVTAALGGLAAASRAIDFTGAAVQGARDLERNYAGLESVFKDNTEQMKAFGETASDLGLSMSEAAKATTFIGSVLKQSGFAMQETSDLTEELVGLGADLALTFGYDIQESLLAMTALFRGEYDPIEKFGVAMKQSEIDAEKLARGLDGVTGAEERLVDQQIRVEFLMERAADAMGAVDRQSGNLTVQQMRLRAEFENVRDTVAADLLPVIADFTGGIREIVDDAGPGLEEVFSDLAPVLEDLGQDILPLLQAGIEGVIEFTGQLVDFLDEALDPSTDLGQSFEDLGTALGELIGDTSGLPSMEENFETFTSAVIDLNDALTELVETVNEVKDPIVDLFEDIGNSLESSGLSEEAGFVAAVTTIGVLATNLERVSKVVKKIPKTGLIGVALFGAGAVGSDQEDQIDRAREKIQDYEGDLDDLYYTAENSADAFAYLEAQTLKQADAMGYLSDEYLRQNPEAAALLEKYKELNPEFTDFKDELTNGRIAANELGLSDGLPTWLNAVKDRAAEARSEVMGFKEATLQVLQLELRDLMRFGAAQEDIDALRTSIAELMKDPTGGDDPDDPDGPSKKATDYVAEFFNGIKDGIEKEAARLDLEALGLSEALIDQILGSQGWEELFETITDGGAEMARQLQNDFNQTATGIQELAEAAEALQEELEDLRAQQEELQTQITDTQQDQKDALKEATDAFYEYKEGINNTVDALDTYERSIGRFESQTRSDLDRITAQINDAFDNGYLLEEARDNLLDYARAELNVLMQLQRQRDDLLAQRNAAADTIFGIAQAVTSAGNLTRLLSDVQDEVKEVEVKELFEDVVQSADGLNNFKVTLERNYTDVVTDTVNKSQSLVNNFQAVIDRTKNFIANLIELRKLGLDPFLFNQLVDAGAEAGGATAQALVEGGADTVKEVNSLQSQLEAMGVELGEETYEVTKNSGAQFVSGIVDGMDAELTSLGEMAQTMATNFTTTFEILFKAGMENAFDGILDDIRSEYQALIEELEKELQKIRDRIADAERDTRVSTGESIIVDGVEVTEGSSSIGPDNVGDLPQSEQDFLKDAFPELFGETNAMASTRSNATTINLNVNASNRTGGQQAGQEIVKTLKQYQTANGPVTTSLTGFGS